MNYISLLATTSHISLAVEKVAVRCGSREMWWQGDVECDGRNGWGRGVSLIQVGTFTWAKFTFCCMRSNLRTAKESPGTFRSENDSPHWKGELLWVHSVFRKPSECLVAHTYVRVLLLSCTSENYFLVQKESFVGENGCLCNHIFGR